MMQRSRGRVTVCILAAVVAACGDSDAAPADAGSAGDGPGEQDASQATRLADAPLEVELPVGTVRGMESLGARAFLGIPFGASTAGEGRWAAPEPAPSWDTPRDAMQYGAVCSQLDPTGASFVADSSEDCLFLNVWTPTQLPDEPLPVMVWIHGGAYVFGSGGEPYNGEKLAQAGNVVVVSFNYRLGALGFLAHPALSARVSGTDTPPANLGLLDQQLALRWVNEHIAAFGGDPQAITLFGESAGANSVCAHLLAESSRGLFQRAIVESGLCMKPNLTLEQAETLGSSFGAALGCEGSGDEALSCLQALTPEAIQTGPARESLPGGVFFQPSFEQYAFSPIVDGTLLTEQPEAAFAAGHFARLPVLHGATTAEGALFHAAPLGGVQPEDDAAFMAALTVRFGARAAEVAAQYPPAEYPSYAEALSAVTSDALFRCPAIRMAEYLRDAGVENNYLYRFDLTVETTFAGLAGHAFHSSDIPYVFGNDYILGMIAEADRPASDAVQGYWTRFAHRGDPNGDGAVQWPLFDAAAGHLELGRPIAAGANWRSDGCDFWDDVEFAP